MKSQVLHTVWSCRGIWHWSLLGVKGVKVGQAIHQSPMCILILIIEIWLIGLQPRIILIHATLSCYAPVMPRVLTVSSFWCGTENKRSLKLTISMFGFLAPSADIRFEQSDSPQFQLASCNCFQSQSSSEPTACFDCDFCAIHKVPSHVSITNTLRRHLTEIGCQNLKHKRMTIKGRSEFRYGRTKHADHLGQCLSDKIALEAKPNIIAVPYNQCTRLRASVARRCGGQNRIGSEAQYHISAL